MNEEVEKLKEEYLETVRRQRAAATKMRALKQQLHQEDQERVAQASALPHKSPSLDTIAAVTNEETSREDVLKAQTATGASAAVSESAINKNAGGGEETVKAGKAARVRKRPKYDDQIKQEQQELGYAYDEWVPPPSAKHYSL